MKAKDTKATKDTKEPKGPKGRVRRTGARRPRRAGSRVALAAKSGTTRVVMKIDLGAGAPGDVISIRRIDGRALSGAGTRVGSGTHTVGWDVVSPTVRPIGFDVTLTDEATGRKLLDRPKQKTGRDGRAAGAGTFRV